MNKNKLCFACYVSLIVSNKNIQFNVSVFSHDNFIHIINKILFDFHVLQKYSDANTAITKTDILKIT